MGTDLVAERRGAGSVEAVRAPGLEALGGDLDALVDELDGPLGDADALRERAEVGVSARGLGDDRDTHGVAVGVGGGDIAAGRLDTARDAPEQVDLVGNAEAAIDGTAAAAAARQGLACGQALVAAVGVEADAGQPVAANRTQSRAGPVEVGRGDRDVLVRRQSVTDEAVEDRVLVQPPPGAVGTLGRRDGRGGAEERRRGAGDRLRVNILGTDLAGGESQQQGQAGVTVECSALHRHGSYSAGCRAAASVARRLGRQPESARQTT